MLRKKYSLLWTCLIIVVVGATLVISCSQSSPASNLTTSAKSPEATSKTLVNKGLQASPSVAGEQSAGPTVAVPPKPTEATPETPVAKEPETSPTIAGEPAASPTATVETPQILTWQDLSKLVYSDPAQLDNSKFPITPVEDIGVTGVAPNVDIATYNLTVDGLVKNPLNLNYETLLKYPTVTEVVLLICPGVFVANAEWTGVPVSTFLNEAGMEPQASQVTFHTLDSYQRTFPLADVLKDSVFLAYQVNGQILPKEHGYPLRLVMRGAYGSSWVKWVNRLEIK